MHNMNRRRKNTPPKKPATSIIPFAKEEKPVDGWAGLHGFLKDFHELPPLSCAVDRKRLEELQRKSMEKQTREKDKVPNPLEADFDKGVGRPFNEEDRKKLRDKHDVQKMTWKEVTESMNKETGINREQQSYEKLYKTDPLRKKPHHKA